MEWLPFFKNILTLLMEVLIFYSLIKNKTKKLVYPIGTLVVLGVLDCYPLPKHPILHFITLALNVLLLVLVIIKNKKDQAKEEREKATN